MTVLQDISEILQDVIQLLQNVVRVVYDDRTKNEHGQAGAYSVESASG